MYLRQFNYSEFTGEPRQWCLKGLVLGRVNLLVGKNAEGKSRTLNSIHELARIVSGTVRQLPISAKFDATFSHDEEEHRYVVEFDHGFVVKEEFEIDGRYFLKRGPTGGGKIWAEELDCDISFQAPVGELVAVTRRDAIQHPYFDELFRWGRGLRHYGLSGAMARDRTVFLETERLGTSDDPLDGLQVLRVFRAGMEAGGDTFKQAVLEDAAVLGYELEDLGLGRPRRTIQFDGMGDVLVLHAQEKRLSFPTEQDAMSQGMYRALSILIHLHYALLTGRRSCLLIDDIGEGMDFERSASLAKLLLERVSDSGVQLIMSTNDRHVMNVIPLSEWSVLRREANDLLRVYNHENSREAFEDFRFTGLNNFDFLATDFLSGAPEGDE